MCLSSRTLVTALTASCIGVAAATGHAQPLGTFPVKPIRLVVPFGIGSPSDALARTIGPKLSETWGHSVVVDNRPGANGVVGATIVAKAIPDGHTLLITSASFVVALLCTPRCRTIRVGLHRCYVARTQCGCVVVSPSWA